MTTTAVLSIATTWIQPLPTMCYIR